MSSLDHEIVCIVRWSHSLPQRLSASLEASDRAVDGELVTPIARVTEHYEGQLAVARRRSRNMRILTNKAVVVTTEDVGHSYLDTSVGQLEVVTNDDWGLEVTGPQKDETVVIGDLSRLRRKVPEIGRCSQ